jgi:hypothetical protein
VKPVGSLEVNPPSSLIRVLILRNSYRPTVSEVADVRRWGMHRWSQLSGSLAQVKTVANEPQLRVCGFGSSAGSAASFRGAC